LIALPFAPLEVSAQGAAAVVATTTSGRIEGDSVSISELVGLPVLDAAKVLVRLAAASTITDLNSLSNKALALQISTLIAEDDESENLLADLRARVSENRPHLARSLLQQLESCVPALQGESHRCSHCGAPLQEGAT
jgi:hypothetical protein